MPLSVSPTQRWGAVMAELPTSNVIVLFGGRTTANTSVPWLLSDTWTWSGTTWTQVVASGPSARGDAMAAYDGTTISLACGADEHTKMSDTWIFNGTTWTNKNIAALAGPSRLSTAGMAYLSGSSEDVLFGGRGFISHYIIDTWTWNGTAWTLLTPATNPPGRADHAMASSSSTVVLFGGTNFDGPLSDTWSFNGTTWAQLATTQTPGSTSPSARTGAVMAYDANHTQWVLFGGKTKNEYNNETWTFDGTAWTKQSPGTSPPGRSRAMMAYDSHNHNVLLFGGLGYDRDFGDTWLWDGTNWTQQ